MVEGDEIDMISLEYWDTNEEVYWTGDSADNNYADGLSTVDTCTVLNSAQRDMASIAMYALAEAGLIEI